MFKVRAGGAAAVRIGCLFGVLILSSGCAGSPGPSQQADETMPRSAQPDPDAYLAAVGREAPSFTDSDLTALFHGNQLFCGRAVDSADGVTKESIRLWTSEVNGSYVLRDGIAMARAAYQYLCPEHIYAVQIVDAFEDELGRTISGTLEIEEGFSASMEQCTPIGGFSDLDGNPQVVVRDASDDIVGVGSLSDGRITPSDACRFVFTIAQLAESSFYSIQTQSRGAVVYSTDELVRADWRIALHL